MPDVAEPPTTTSSEAPKSFLNSPEFDAEIEKALAADNATRGGKDKPGAIAPAPPAPAPTPEPPKPTEPKPGEKAGKEDEMPADIRSPETQSTWKKLKESKARVEKERDEWKTKHDTANARIAEMEKAAKTPAQQAKLDDNPEYQQLKALAESREKTLEEYSERLRLVDVEQHPKFQAYFRNKIDGQLEVAKEIGGDKLVEALRLPNGEYRNEKLREIVAELGPLEQSQLGSVLTNLRAIDSERAREIAAAKENYQQIQAQQKEQTEKQRREVENTFKAVAQEVTSVDKGMSVFHEREGDAEWNKGVQERLALAQAAFNGSLKPDGMARMLHWGAAAPVLLTELNGAQARIVELEKELTGLRALTPNPGGGVEGGNEAPQPAKGLDGMMEMITAALPSR